VSTKRFLFIFILTGILFHLLFLSESQSTELTPKEILDKIDKMWTGKSSIGTYTMKIKTTHWERTLRIKSWTRGFDYTLIRIEFPKKE